LLAFLRSPAGREGDWDPLPADSCRGTCLERGSSQDPGGRRRQSRLANGEPAVGQTDSRMFVRDSERECLRGRTMTGGRGVGVLSSSRERDSAARSCLPSAFNALLILCAGYRGQVDGPLLTSV
jgi:hypothetical protein